MSMIEFSCPSCDAQYRVPAKAGGKQAKCKSCGKSMAVPKSSASSASGSGSGTGSAGNVDLSGLYNSAAAGSKPTTVAAPSLEGGSVFATSRPRRGGPSPVLLIGLGGGAVVLILAVVLIVVLMGGGEDPDPTPNPGAGPATVSAGPSRVRGQRGNRETTTDRTPPTTDPEDNGNDNDPNPPTTVAQGREVAAPAAGLPGAVDWTLPVPEKVATYAEQVEVRGMVLTLPPEWLSDTTTLKAIVADAPDLRNELTQHLGQEVLETVILDARPREALVDVSFAMSVSRNVETAAWPTFASIGRVTPAALGLDDIDEAALRNAALSADPEVGGAIAELANRFDERGVAYNPFKPQRYFINDNAYDSVEFGTLFGGHPFARVVINNESQGTQTLLYAGSVGHMQITMTATVPTQYPELLDDMDWVMRSAKLMTPAQAREYAPSDPIYDSWMNNTFVDIAYAGDNAPHPGLTQPGWDGFGERSQFQRSAAASIVTPYRQPYGIIAPEGLRLASANRVAARWHANSDGMWLQMKVTKLEGREQRTMTSPILPAQGDTGERLFVQSRAIPLPAGYEHTQIQADEITLHRVLLPAVQGQSMRKVYYVLFDGADQVTIEGRYDPNRPQDLEQLDAAAQTLTRI